VACERRGMSLAGGNPEHNYPEFGGVTLISSCPASGRLGYEFRRHNIHPRDAPKPNPPTIQPIRFIGKYVATTDGQLLLTNIAPEIINPTRAVLRVKSIVLILSNIQQSPMQQPAQNISAWPRASRLSFLQLSVVVFGSSPLRGSSFPF